MTIVSIWRSLSTWTRAFLLGALAFFLLFVLLFGYRVRDFYASEVQSTLDMERVRITDAAVTNADLLSVTLRGLRGFFLGSQEVTHDEWMDYVSTVGAQTISGSRGLYYVEIDSSADVPVIRPVFSYSVYGRALFDGVGEELQKHCADFLLGITGDDPSLLLFADNTDQEDLRDVAYIAIPVREGRSFLLHRINLSAFFHEVTFWSDEPHLYHAHFFLSADISSPVLFDIGSEDGYHTVDNAFFSSRFVSTSSVRFFDQSLFIDLRALPEYWRDTSYYIVPVLLWIGGVVLSFLIFVGLFILFSSRQEALVLARRLTKDMREKMRELERFHSVVDHASDHIVITDKDGAILYANNAVERITGYKKKEVIGNTPRLWGGQMSKDFYARLWDTIKNKKKPFIGQLTNKRKNGELYEAESRISPVLDERGDVEFFIGIERDITEEKRIEESKTEFVSLASHQLRTPVSIVNWYTEMLLQGDAGRITKKQKEYLSQIYDASRRMGDLVKALLNVSRIELGTISVTPEHMDIGGVITNIVQDWKKMIDEKQLSVSYTKDPSVPDIFADPVVAKVILDNIISNAIKYTPEKGSVDILLYPQKDDLVVEVRDTGFGIPRDEQKNVFEKFFRADNIAQKDTTGTGLGLYLTKEILSIVGGSIRFVSEENKGTTFFIHFPLKGMRAQKGVKELSV